MLQRLASDVTLINDEESPLLDSGGNPDGPLKPSRSPARPTPLPKVPLAALCTLRVVEPVAFTHIFPFVNELCLAATNDPARVGFYSGAVESAFALAQLCSIYQWAQLSDVVGRRPVLFIGAIGLGVASVLFGLSRTLAGLVLSRCLAGLFSGTVAVVHSVLGELTDSSNQSTAFPLYALFWPLGAVIGPLLGGMLAHPADKFPHWFSGTVWTELPYLLPGCAVALLAAIAVTLAYFFLDETLPSKRAARMYTPHPHYGSTNPPEPVPEPAPEPAPTCAALLAHPLTRALCLSGAALSFVGTAFDVLFVLFCFTPVAGGGLGFSAAQIGYALALAGASSALIQASCLPALLRRCEPGALFATCMYAWPPAFALLPMLHWLAAGGPPTPVRTVALWLGVGAALAASRVGCIAYSVSMVLVKESAPGASTLARTNGLAQFAQCSARAVAPALVSAVFAATAGSAGLVGYVWAGAMVLVSAWACTLGRAVVRAREEEAARG